MIHFKWCSITKTLSWPLVEFIKLLLDIGIRYVRLVFPFREIFPEQPIGVLVCATFPRMMRQWEVEFHLVQRRCDLRVLRKFLAAIRRDRPQRLILQSLNHHCIYGVRLFGIRFPTYQISALSVYQRHQAGLSFDARHGIAFPMPASGTIGSTSRTLGNIMADLDFAAVFFILFGMSGLAAMPELSDDAPAAV